MANRGPTVNSSVKGGMAGTGHGISVKKQKSKDTTDLEFDLGQDENISFDDLPDFLKVPQKVIEVDNSAYEEEQKRLREEQLAREEAERQAEEARRQAEAEELARINRIKSIFKGDGLIETEVHLPNAKLEGPCYNFNQIQEPQIWGLQKVITETIKNEKLQEVKKAPEPPKKEKTLEEMLEDGEINERTYKRYKAKEEKEAARKKSSKRKNNEVDETLSLTNEEWIEQIEAAKKANEDLDAMLKAGEISKKEYKERKKDSKYIIPNPKYPLDKYPKEYFDPTDVEVDEKDGKSYYYFNVEKTLRKYNLAFIKKLKPLYSSLEQWTFDNPAFDNVANKQHEKAEKLNSLPPLKQYEYDKNLKLKKIGGIAAFIICIFMYITQIVIPAHKFENAGNLFIRQDYENAYYAFNELGDYNNSHIYTHYCEAQMLYKTEQYEKSAKYFNDLIPYQDFFDNDAFEDANDSIQNLYYESVYQQGLIKYAEKDYEGARAIFKTISSYNQATQYYYKCSYELAEGYASKGDYFNAIDNFYIISKANYQDSKTRMQDIASILYESAIASYAIEDYETAIENFSFLSQYKYSDSANMINQCKYKYALQLFKEKKYEKASEYFNEISQYKDSFALHKECIYKLATIAYNKDPIDSLTLFDKIHSYKNTDNILDSDILFLYGEWNINKINGNKANINFKFKQGGLFYIDEQLTGIAISTAATPYPYSWDGTSFSTDDGNYKIDISIIDSDNAIITCTGDNKSATYSISRVYNYLELLAAEESDGLVESETLTINQRYEKELAEYIDKKTDGIVYINDQEVDVNGAETQMKENLNNIKDNK